MQQENTTGTKKKKPSKARTSRTSAPARSKWGTTIRVNWELYDHIASHGKFGESFQDILQRLLKIA